MLDASSVHKLLYSLQILETIASPRVPSSSLPSAEAPSNSNPNINPNINPQLQAQQQNKSVPMSDREIEGEKERTREADRHTLEEERRKWLTTFCEKGGLAHLYGALLNLPITSLHNPLARKCFALLMKFLCLIQSSEAGFEKHVPEYEKSRGQLVTRVLAVITSFARHSIKPDASRLLRSPRKPRVLVSQKGDKDTKSEEPDTQGRALIQERQKQLEESRAFEHGFRLIQGNPAKRYGYFAQLTASPDFKELITQGLLWSDNKYLQAALAKEIYGICESFVGEALVPGDLSTPIHAHAVLIPFLLRDLVVESLSVESKCQEFYKLVCSVVNLLSVDRLKVLPLNYHERLEHLANLIKAHAIKEIRSSDTDFFIAGQLDLVGALLRKFPEEKLFVGQNCGLLIEVLEHCLFEFPKVGTRRTTGASVSVSAANAALPPKCKSQLARQTAFNLLCILARDCPINLQQILDYLVPIHV